MVLLWKIYTKTGDLGQASVGDGGRISKASLRVFGIGAVDETNCAFGIARRDSQADADASKTTSSIWVPIPDPQDGRKVESRPRIGGPQVEGLEAEIDAVNQGLSVLPSFVLAGGTAASCPRHRKAGRKCHGGVVAERKTINQAALRYAKRLSDHLFATARIANNQGMGDVLWVPGENS
jgi:cob(I)alamin adenosyltransferase